MHAGLSTEAINNPRSCSGARSEPAPPATGLGPVPAPPHLCVPTSPCQGHMFGRAPPSPWMGHWYIQSPSDMKSTFPKGRDGLSLPRRARVGRMMLSGGADGALRWGGHQLCPQRVASFEIAGPSPDRCGHPGTLSSAPCRGAQPQKCAWRACPRVPTSCGIPVSFIPILFPREVQTSG